jgi:glycosyltransferase involved in cell wall biosynthesis
MTTTGLRRLRVGLHVGQLLQPVPGGIGRVTEMLCDELPRHTDVVAFAPSADRARRALSARFVDVEFRGVGPGSPRWRYALWHRDRRHRIEMNVDVCHAPSLALPPTMAPLVVTINDVAFLRHPGAFTPHGVRFHERALEIARREAAAIIVPSAFTCDELVREGFEPSRLHRVPLATRVAALRSPHDLREPPSARNARGGYLLVVGTIEPRKDHATVIAAFERVRRHRPDLTLVIAGAPGWLPKHTALELERPGVVVVGHVSDGELDRLYRSAEIVVNASIYEGFGLTVLEALARACPVVASAIPAHIELVGDAARLFPPRDVDALADMIDALLDDPAERDKLRCDAVARARRFSMAATIEGHLTAYQRATAS